MATQNTQPITTQLQKVSNTLLVVGGEPSVDSLGAALALSLALTAIGKRTHVVTQQAIRVEHSRLVGCDKVTTSVTGSKSYVLSLPDAVDSIEKVSCYAEGTTLNIVLQPYDDVTNFDPSNVQYSKAAGGFDSIMLIDVANKQDAAKVLGDQSALLAEVPIIAIGKIGDPNVSLRYVQPQAAATGQLVGELIADLGVTLTADMANNLLQGVYEASNDFRSPNITPQLFESAANLLKIMNGESNKLQQPMPPVMPKAMPRPLPPLPQNRPGQGQPQRPMPQMPNFPRPAQQPGNFMQPKPAMPPMPNKVATSQEWEVDPFFEFDKLQDQTFGNEGMGATPSPFMPPQVAQQNRPTNQPKSGAREAFQSQTKPPMANRQNRGPQQNPGNQRPRPQDQQQDDWTTPKIYKTEDLL